MGKGICVLFLYLSLALLACQSINKEEDMDIGITVPAYLALGDSYTIGESVNEEQRWPVQLVDRLRADSVDIADARIIARTGWTTDELMAGIEEADPGRGYKLVSLMIGVNNQYRGRDTDNFREELAGLIDTAISCASGIADNVIVLSIPDWSVTPFAAGRDQEKIAAEIDSFNSVIVQECNEAGVKYFDVTGISRKASTDLSLVAGDGLHPSGKMYEMWVEVLYPYVKELLRQQAD
ncbi:MAG: SGNH/GDSL hydrolase family protein [Bacteroidales bacterium]|nr:SGNH/GDSL hydrolase family protein [Bacteroidales bacterium]